MDLGDVPIKIDKISIKGIKKTNHNFIKKQLKDEKIFQAESLKALDEPLSNLIEKLEALAIFKSITPVLDKSPNSDEKFANLHLVLNVEEVNFKTFKGQVLTGLDNSVGLNTTFSANNINGRAEHIDFNYHNNFDSNGGGSFTFIKPLENCPMVKVGFGGWNTNYHLNWSKCIELTTGGFGETTWNTIWGKHQCRLEMMMREMLAKEKAPIEISKENGHSMKAGLKHTFSRDTRDDLFFPESGYNISLSQEIFTDLVKKGQTTGNHVGKELENVNLKLEATLEKAFSLKQFVIENTLGIGYIKSLSNDVVTQVALSDRFFIGGPLDLRGFEIRGAGPTCGGSSNEDRCSLGSNTYLQHGLHLYHPLPYLGKNGFAGLFRLHAFVISANSTFPSFEAERENPNNDNTNLQPSGDCDQIENNFAQLQSLNDWLTNARCTIGMGIAFKMHNLFRMELNYCLPLKYVQGDKINWGLQFGIGVMYS